MKNKVLVELFVPEVEIIFNVYLPINKRIGNLVILISRAINEMQLVDVISENDASLYNRETCQRYNINDLLINTDIRNGASLILL